jgi:hypothetical protein
MGMKRVASLLSLLWGVTSFGQTNSWISGADGNWHDVNSWSAGVLPGTNQTILLTNVGSKTVRIGPNTIVSFPEALNVGPITIAGESNSVNTLLIDSVGTNTPFRSSQLIIREGGALVLVDSDVHSSTWVKGVVNHGQQSRLETRYLSVAKNGVYYLTNGLLRSEYGDIEGLRPNFGSVDSNAPPPSAGVFNQYGGTNSFSSSLKVRGIYNLYDGVVQRHENLWASVSVGDGWGTINQSGGVVDARVVVAREGVGRYNLNGGLRTGGAMIIWSDYMYPWGGHILQTGGTNVGAIEMIPYISPSGEAYPSSYALENGEVRSTAIKIGAFASFGQSGGVHFNESLILSNRYVCRGGSWRRPPICTTEYGRYSLAGGLLMSSNIWSEGQFAQSGGSAIVGDVVVRARFVHEGGDLTVTNVFVQAGGFIDSGGTVRHQGWIGLSGYLECLSRSLALGPLWVDDGASILLFPTNNAALLRFADCRSMLWSNYASLVVRRWMGSFAGRGKHQLYFGSDSSGLTPEQVAQIQFENPAGLRGTFPARILSDGEVVPVPTRIVSERHRTDLRVYWPSGFILQTSTNVNGPFEDLADALNGAAVPFTDPARFFRMRPEQ